jgi:hypothetical protein
MVEEAALPDRLSRVAAKDDSTENGMRLGNKHPDHPGLLPVRGGTAIENWRPRPRPPWRGGTGMN